MVPTTRLTLGCFSPKQFTVKKYSFKVTRLLPSHSLDAGHGALGGRVHLAPFVSLYLSPVISQPRCLGGRVHLSPFVSLHLSPVVSQPGCLARLAGWTGSLVSFVSLYLSPSLRAWHGSRGGSFVSLCLPSFVSRCLPAWMPGTALWLSPFVSLHLSPSLDLARLVLSRVVSQPGCLARLSGWMGSFVFVSLHFPPLSPSLDVWHGSLGGRVHLAPFVSLYLSPVFSQRFSPFICLPLSLVSLCLPSFVFRCLPAWMPGTALWADEFICLPLSPFICLALSPSLDAWHGSLGGRVHLSPFVSLDLSPVISQPGCLARLSWTGSFVSLCICLPLSPFICLPLSPSLDAWHGCLGGRIHFFVWLLGGRIHLSSVVSQPGYLARLFARTAPFVCLSLSFSLDGRIHLSPGLICLPFSADSWWTGSFPSLNVWHGSHRFIWHGSPGGRVCCLRAWMPGTTL